LMLVFVKAVSLSVLVQGPVLRFCPFQACAQSCPVDDFHFLEPLLDASLPIARSLYRLCVQIFVFLRWWRGPSLPPHFLGVGPQLPLSAMSLNPVLVSLLRLVGPFLLSPTPTHFFKKLPPPLPRKKLAICTQKHKKPPFLWSLCRLPWPFPGPV